MSVWFAIPSARPREEVAHYLREWVKQGYRVAAFRNDRESVPAHYSYYADRYPGYAQAVNRLAREILTWRDPNAEWIVTGGDDTLPDPTKTADEIAAECSAHFNGTLGVMQPTGDRFAGGHIDRICGSPWMGREFCLRANGGLGPLWPEYTHMFVDEELQHVALKLGVLWQRRDLVHLHRHFMRVSDALDSNAVQRPTPEFLKEANSPAHWAKFDALFKSRRDAGFPGHEPLPVEVAA